jgi:hypothetical protein
MFLFVQYCSPQIDQKARRNSRWEFVKKEVAGRGNGLAVAPNAAPAPAPGFGSNEIPFDVQRVWHQSTESSPTLLQQW